MYLGPQAEARHRFQRRKSTFQPPPCRLSATVCPSRREITSEPILSQLSSLWYAFNATPVRAMRPQRMPVVASRDPERASKDSSLPRRKSPPTPPSRQRNSPTSFTGWWRDDCTSAQGLTHTQLNIDVRVHLHAPLRIPTLTSAAFQPHQLRFDVPPQNCCCVCPCQLRVATTPLGATYPSPALPRLAAYGAQTWDLSPGCSIIAQRTTKRAFPSTPNRCSPAAMRVRISGATKESKGPSGCLLIAVRIRESFLDQER